MVDIWKKRLLLFRINSERIKKDCLPLSNTKATREKFGILLVTIDSKRIDLTRREEIFVKRR